jgi:rhamnosyltransferase
MSNFEKNISCAVIIATYNGERYLKEQLVSIRQQIDVQANIYYSDDESKDDSRTILENLGCINLNSEERAYGSSAANFLNALSKYKINDHEDYIFLSDQDDIWLPNKMIEAVAALEKNNSDAYSGSFFSWNIRNRQLRYTNKNFQQNDIDYFFRSPGPGFTFCITRRAFQIIQTHLKINSEKYQNIRWHDWLLYAIARENGIKWFIDRTPYALYRLHENNDTGQITSILNLSKRLQFLLYGDFREQVNILLEGQSPNRLSLAMKRFSISDRIFLIYKIPLMRSKMTDRLALLIWLICERKRNVNKNNTF